MLGSIVSAGLHVILVVLILLMIFLLTILLCSLHEEKKRIAGKVAFPLSEMPSHIFFRISRGTTVGDQEFLTMGKKSNEQGFRKVVHPCYKFIYLPGDTLVKYGENQTKPFYKI